MRLRSVPGFRWFPAAGLGLGLGLSLGCAGPRVVLPTGHLPPPPAATDRTPLPDRPARPEAPPQGVKEGAREKSGFDLPREFPGADAPGVQLPRFEKDTPAAERERVVQATYPRLQPVDAGGVPVEGDQPAMTLGELQEIAFAASPVIRQAGADAEAALGRVIQAGLYPNPTVGYQSDQVQPGLVVPPGATFSGAGQQGGFVNQLIKTAGKLKLAQQVAGYDYINALIAVRRAQIDVTNAVRTQFFAVLVAQQNLEVNRSLARLADDVYRIQLRQVEAGETAGYEPLQLYAQAVQARNALAQAEATYRSAWRQLAAAAGQPDLPFRRVQGRADGEVPRYSLEELRERMLREHTDLLTGLNRVAQAQRNVVLQRRLPVPDISTNSYHQYDNIAQTYQFGLQIGLAVPIFDRNQGNIRAAQAQVASAGEQLRATQNQLLGRLAEAYGRYESATAIARNYRDKVLPSLTQAYRLIIRRYQVETDKVSFNDIVVAQQNLAQALQTYLAALNGEWQAVVDLANLAQLDDLQVVPAPAPNPPAPTEVLPPPEVKPGVPAK